MGENSSLWHYLEFPEKSVLQNTFLRLIRIGLKMTSNEKLINMKVVGNFKPYDLE
jgi:hypothetical protein